MRQKELGARQGACHIGKPYPNGTCAYHAYDAAGRLSRLENRKSDATVISRFEFARDPNGNITRSLREDGSCWYYAYDGLQRLTGADWKDADAVPGTDAVEQGSKVPVTLGSHNLMHGHELRRVESFRRFARDPNGNITQSLREDASC